MCAGYLSRRGLLAALAAAALAGCSDNPQTGRSQLMIVDDGQLAAMADDSWTQILQQVPPVADPAAHAQLTRIGRRIVEAAGLTDRPWEFVVLDSADQNAFVLPNGKVGFFRGLLGLARSDDEVAAVLGHEVGHLVARHPAERVSQQLAVQAGVGLTELLLSQGENADNAQAIAAALGLGAAYGVILPYSRKHELEADRVGVELMAKAGYDPKAAVSFWTRMTERQAGQPKAIEALSTHPADARRLAELKAAVGA
jgi:predicted Zn-dependent protease